MTPLVALSGVRVPGPSGPRLDVAALEVAEGQVLSVLGPTGAGKSTLLQVVHLLLRPLSGEVRWRGEAVPWPAPLPLRRRMAMAFQDPLLFSGSVLENVEFGLRLRGVPRGERRRQAEEALGLLRVDALAGRRAATLSGGEARRVSLARALVVGPELLLLDEPLASLDEPIRAAILADLRAVVRARGITGVLVTHDQAEGFAVADRVAVLSHGRVAQVGTPEEVYYRPGSRLVAELVRTGNVLAGVVVESGGGLVRVRVGSATLEAVGDLAPGTRVVLCVRPEEVVVQAPPSSAASSARNRMTGTVRSVAVEGAVVRVEVECGCTLAALVTRRSAAELALAPGLAVGVELKATATHVLPESEG